MADGASSREGLEVEAVLCTTSPPREAETEHLAARLHEAEAEWMRYRSEAEVLLRKAEMAAGIARACRTLLAHLSSHVAASAYGDAYVRTGMGASFAAPGSDIPDAEKLTNTITTGDLVPIIDTILAEEPLGMSPRELRDQIVSRSGLAGVERYQIINALVRHGPRRNWVKVGDGREARWFHTRHGASLVPPKQVAPQASLLATREEAAAS